MCKLLTFQSTTVIVALHAEERKACLSGSTPIFPLHHHLDLQPACTTSRPLSAPRQTRLRMIPTSGSSPWKQELISRSSCVGIPAGSHEAIWGLRQPPTAPAALSLPHPPLLSEIYSTTHPPPLTNPPDTHSEVTPSEVLHFLLSLSAPLSLYLWWMSSTLWDVSACPSRPAIRN